MTLVYTWVLDPQSPATTPADLDPADKETYILLVAAAYRHDGNLEKANRRLAKLKDNTIADTVVSLAELYIANGADARDTRSLVSLAAGLDKATGPMLVYLVTPTIEPTITPTRTPKPTKTPPPTVTKTPAHTATAPPKSTVSSTITPRTTATPGKNAPFELAQSVALCDNNATSELRVFIRDRKGNGVPGIEIRVSWPGGEDRFYTGFKSEHNPGYADFRMAADQTYQIELVNLPSLQAAQGINQNAQDLCPNLPEDVSPSWQVVFQQGGNR